MPPAASRGCRCRAEEDLLADRHRAAVAHRRFSYRRKTRERPLIGDRRPPSPLGDIQPEAWPAEYTTELLDLLNVLGLLVELEPQQAAMLERVLAGPLITLGMLRDAGVLSAVGPQASKAAGAHPQLF